MAAKELCLIVLIMAFLCVEVSVQKNYKISYENADRLLFFKFQSYFVFNNFLKLKNETLYNSVHYFLFGQKLLQLTVGSVCYRKKKQSGILDLKIVLTTWLASL
jgi:hypothetical protein